VSRQRRRPAAAGAARSLGAAEAAAFLGITPSRLHQLRHERKITSAPGDAIALDDLLATDVGERRLRTCSEVVESGEHPAIATDRHERILAVNTAAERLLYRAPGDLVGRSLAELVSGIPGGSRHDAEVEIVQARWDVGIRQVVVIRPRRRDDLSAVPPGLPEDRRGQIEEALSSVQAARGGDWCAEAMPLSYPVLGGGTVRTVGRVVPFGEPPQGFEVHYFRMPRLTATISEHASALHFAPFVETELRFGEHAMSYARTIATEVMAEACTIFVYRRLTALRAPDLPGTGSARPRALVAVGFWGFPEILSAYETFYAGGDSAGLVLDVVESCMWRAVDFEEPDVARTVRQPNFVNAALNSRFGRLRNALIVPIFLGPDAAGVRTPIGAIRLLNCFRPVRGGGFEPVDPIRLGDVDPLRRIARRIALLYLQVRSAAHADVLQAGFRALREAAPLPDLLERLARHACRVLEFDHIVVWRLESTGLSLAHYDGVGREALDPALADTTHAVRALERRQTVDVADAEPGVAGRHCGFVVPVYRVGGPAWGALGFYESWAARPGTPVALEVRGICEALATVVGAAASLAER
jgi:hypothetical protein